MNWHNVSKHEPCPICHKTDWCNLSNDGAVCICHRVESPHLARSGSGWIHRLIDQPSNYFTPRASCCRTLVVSRLSDTHQSPINHQSPTLDFSRVHASYSSDPILVEGLATTLGVDDLALKSLDVRFNRFDECWSFPMRNADGQIIGLRFRELAGSRKWSARGSKDGLFYAHAQSKIPNPQSLLPELVIVEGPSDTAAAISLFHHSTPAPSNCTYLPVGRSSCQTGTAHLTALIRRIRPARITIVADNDTPGIKGAELLAGQLVTLRPTRVLIVPHPYKDLRAWYLSNTLSPRLFADLASAQRWRY